MGLKRYAVGDKVILTTENINTIKKSSRSGLASPSYGYVHDISEFVTDDPRKPIIGEVTHISPSGCGDVTVRFNGRSFHAREYWLTPAHELLLRSDDAKEMIMGKTEVEASVYRFRDKVGTFLGSGDTVYLSPDEAIQIANHLMTCALDIKEKDFLSSQFKTSAIAVGRDTDRHEASAARQKPVYLYAVTGRVPGADDDTTLIVSAADDDAACEAFANEMMADIDDERKAFLLEKYGDVVYNTGLQRIGAIAGSFVLVEDKNLLPGVFDESEMNPDTPQMGG